MLQTKPCKCGYKMILQLTGEVLSTYPAQYKQEWWCDCGNREEGPLLREKTADEITLDEWKEANE